MFSRIPFVRYSSTFFWSFLTRKRWQAISICGTRAYRLFAISRCENRRLSLGRAARTFARCWWCAYERPNPRCEICIGDYGWSVSSGKSTPRDLCVPERNRTTKQKTNIDARSLIHKFLKSLDQTIVTTTFFFLSKMIPSVLSIFKNLSKSRPRWVNILNAETVDLFV